MATKFAIQRANDVQVRRQISNALNLLGTGVNNITGVFDGDTVVVNDGGQLMAWDRFVIEDGLLVIDGDFVVL